MRYLNDQDPYQQVLKVNGHKAEQNHISDLLTRPTVDQNQDLYVELPKQADNMVILKGTVKRVFDLKITSKSGKSYPVDNFARAVISSKTIDINGKKVIELSNHNIWALYQDQWLSEKERKNRVRQGMGINFNQVRGGGFTGREKTITDEEKAVCNLFGKQFEIPLDFELIDDLPFYGKGLYDKVTFILRFAPYNQVIIDPGISATDSSSSRSSTTTTTASDPDATYSITNICIEYDVIQSPQLAMELTHKYMSCSIPYRRILHHSKIPLKKEDDHWRITQVNAPSKSLQAIALFFIDPTTRKPYNHLETFYNPKIKKINIDVNGIPNKLYSNGFQGYNAFKNACNFFGSNEMDIHKFAYSNYCVLLNFTSTKTDRDAHGAGLTIEGKGVTLHISREADTTAGALDCHVFVVQDGLIQLQDGKVHSIEF